MIPMVGKGMSPEMAWAAIRERERVELEMGKVRQAIKEAMAHEVGVMVKLGANRAQAEDTVRSGQGDPIGTVASLSHDFHVLERQLAVMSTEHLLPENHSWAEFVASLPERRTELDRQQDERMAALGSVRPDALPRPLAAMAPAPEQSAADVAVSNTPVGLRERLESVGRAKGIVEQGENAQAIASPSAASAAAQKESEKEFLDLQLHAPEDILNGPEDEAARRQAALDQEVAKQELEERSQEERREAGEAVRRHKQVRRGPQLSL